MNLPNKRQYKLSDLIQGLDVTLKGDPECVIVGVAPIHQAKAGHITFLNNALYRKHLATTQASAVILSPDDAEVCHVAAVISRNPYYTYSKIATRFAETKVATSGIHASAVIGNNNQIDSTVTIGPNCTIGNGVKIGAHAYIAAGCVIGDDCELGDHVVLDPNVTLYYRVKIGKRVHLSSGVVIGSDGFGFAKHEGAWHEVPQLGSVVIGDDVSVGANTTIDRGALEDTVIGDGVKLDNLIQVAHNVSIGANTVMAGCVGIAGSTKIGKNCMVGGGSCINGHITIVDGTVITGMTAVTKSIQEPGIYSSGVVGAVPNDKFLKNNARFHRLENLMQRVKALELALKEITERK